MAGARVVKRNLRTVLLVYTGIPITVDTSTCHSRAASAWLISPAVICRKISHFISADKLAGRRRPLLASLTGDLFGRVSDTVVAMVSSSGPTTLLNNLTAPALLVQGTYDSLFALQQAVVNAQTVLANPYDTPVKMIVDRHSG